MGNARLLRGPGGLGETVRDTLYADRDTWVETGTRNGGPALLVANTGTYEAVTHLHMASWSIPDTNDPTLVIRSVVLFAPWIARDTLSATNPMTIEVHADTTAWDTTAISWPGPAPGHWLGQATEDFRTDTLTIPLTLASPLDSLKKWARDPSSVPGFQLRAPNVTPGSIATYKAGSVKIRVAYDHGLPGSVISDVRDSYATTDLYVHSPATSIATGSDPLLHLGGVEGLGVAVRFDTPSVPPGAAINEASLILQVDAATDSIPFIHLGATVDLEVRTAGADWSETATSQSALAVLPTPIATILNFTHRSPADSLITIRLPASTLRAWAAAPSTNHGLVITAVRGDLVSPIFLDSRESLRPPELRVSYTTAPKGRF